MAEIKNPNQGGGGSQSNSTFLIMLVVMFAVFAGLQFYKSRQKQPLQPPTAQQSTSAPASAPTGSKAEFNANAVQAPAASGASNAVSAAAEQTTTIENELYKITFTNRGAEVRSWILKKFKSRYGAPLDLVNAKASQQFGFPMSLYTYDAATTNGLKQALFVPSATGNLLAPQTLTFKYTQGNVDVVKTFSFDSTYVLKASVSVKVNGAPVRALLSWPAGFGDQEQVLDYNGSRAK